jgi:hypothetical protein
MDPAAQSLETLLWWSRMLLACTIALAAEAGALTFLTSLWRRPWYERLAALLPLGAFTRALWSARQASDASAAAQAYATFVRAHYPPEFLWRGGELAVAVNQVSRSGELVVVLTAAALLLGVLLALTHWRDAWRRRAVLRPSGTASQGDRGADDQELDITYQALHDPVQAPLPDGEAP